MSHPAPDSTTRMSSGVITIEVLKLDVSASDRALQNAIAFVCRWVMGIHSDSDLAE